MDRRKRIARPLSRADQAWALRQKRNLKANSSPQTSKAVAHLTHECLRLFECGEVPAFREFVEVNQLCKPFLRPAFRRPENLFWKNRATDRNCDRIHRRRAKAFPI